LEIYLLFAATTALAGLYELVMPVISILKASNPELNLVRHRGLTYVVSTVLMFVAAPIFFPLTLVPGMGTTFRAALHKSMLGEQA
jgi:pilus assembly protein TadC